MDYCRLLCMDMDSDGLVSQEEIMSENDTAKDINRVTGVIIKVSLKLIITALLILVLYEGMHAGFNFGYEIFADTAVSSAPGTEITIEVKEDATGRKVGKMLKEKGLIHNEYAFWVQSIFYDYTIYPGSYTLNTAMTSREILDELSVKPEEGENAS